jgi:hypothetical protein
LQISNPFNTRQIFDSIYKHTIEDEKEKTEYYATKTNTQLVIEALFGAEINSTVWDEEIKPIQAFEQALRKIATNANDTYFLSHYDSLLMTVKDLDNFTDINLRFILEQLLKYQDLVLNDDDLVFIADINYLTNIGDVLQNTTKR